MNHVGPAGLNCFVGRLLPRPDGRGYCMTALRAREPSLTLFSRLRFARASLLDHWELLQMVQSLRPEGPLCNSHDREVVVTSV